MSVPSGIQLPKLTGSLSLSINYVDLKVYNSRGQKIGNVVNHGDGRGWEAHRKGKVLDSGETLQDAADLISAAATRPSG